MQTRHTFGCAMTRRRFAALSGSAVASIALGGACASRAAAVSDGRLTSRPREGVKTSASGAKDLGVDQQRKALLQIPARASTEALPVLVMLHGAGGRAEQFLPRFGPAADHAGIALLVADSASTTWDAIRGGDFGADVALIDRALARVFETVAVDPARLAVGGFSDGATYALALGLINGDLFQRIVAFSPGFLIPGTAHGSPRVFVSHGIEDPILPIERCSRRIVPALRQRGYEVVFREFDGGHEVPAGIGREGLEWMRSPSGDRT